jgi:hypothetical protein
MSLLTGYARVIDQEQNGQGVKALLDVLTYNKTHSNTTTHILHQILISL